MELLPHMHVQHFHSGAWAALIGYVLGALIFIQLWAAPKNHSLSPSIQNFALSSFVSTLHTVEQQKRKLEFRINNKYKKAANQQILKP